MRAVIGILMVFLLSACQDKPQTGANKVVKNTTSTAVDADNKASTTKLSCISKHTIKKSPPVQDKSKIKAMLLKSGKITAEMTTEQADKVVNDFIRAKQNPHNKGCK